MRHVVADVRGGGLGETIDLALVHGEELEHLDRASDGATGLEPVFPHRRALLPANQRLAAC
jgi:hypothetical protein